MYRVLQLQFVIAASIGTYFIENAPNVSKRAEAIVHCKNVIFNIVAKYWVLGVNHRHWIVWHAMVKASLTKSEIVSTKTVAMSLVANNCHLGMYIFCSSPKLLKSAALAITYTF